MANDFKYDFSGVATKANVLCSDGRTIMPDAFKDDDGKIVPMVWNHCHNSPDNVIGHALLKNEGDCVRAYGSFNDTEQGQLAKKLVEHGDIDSLSIFANKLKQVKGSVQHGKICELSLVIAGANPGAFIDEVIRHGEISEDEGIIFSGESIELSHADTPSNDTQAPKKEDSKVADEKNAPEKGGKTLQDVVDTMNEEQKTAMYALIGAAIEDNGKSDDKPDEEDKPDTKGGDQMKHNLFEGDDQNIPQEAFLSHADEANILNMAKSNSIGSLQTAIDIYADQNETLAHSIENLDTLFPDYKDVRPGMPETLRDDESWVPIIMNKTSKSPISRIRTRFIDARTKSVGDALRAMGYQKGSKKNEIGNLKQLKRTTDPQTVYIKDKLDRDDIIDITDFDVVNYIWSTMRQNLNHEVAQAIMIGDGRDEGDENKISEDHIRSIWNDDELYTIHKDIDIEKAKTELQGTNTGANFGENYIYAEAIITAALYAREDYKGSGSPDFFCTPHLLNVMLLARDLNGRRIYNSVSDIAAALNVKNIYTVEQFAGKIRTDASNKQHALLGIFVNLSDYQLGSTKGGQISQFNQFDIDFNQEKYLIETRLSGALTKIQSAIALEELVTA